MPKINIKVMLHNITEDKFFSNELVGIITDNKIKYIDNGITVIVSFKADDIYLNRSCDEYNIHMPFVLNKLTTGIYNIEKLGSLNLDILTTHISIGDHKLEIHYNMIIDNIDVQKFNYIIEFKEMQHD